MGQRENVRSSMLKAETTQTSNSRHQAQGALTEASAGLAAARAMKEAAAAGLDRARMAAQDQELAGLREALAFEEALRQQVCRQRGPLRVSCA